jgi:thymidylate synthase ThyX
MPIETIQEIIRQKIEPLLPPMPVPVPTPKTEKAEVAATKVAKKTKTVTENPYVRKNADGVFEITEAGYQLLDEAVTNTKGNVYGFSDKFTPVTVAAAMARLSRRGDDMRVTLLDEFALASGKDEKLLKRIITAYGDDSVQQLVGQHIVVENGSQLLIKKLEWGRLAAYLEQSTRYIYYDQKDLNGRYKYYVPDYLPTNLKTAYQAHMDELFRLYSNIVHVLTKYVTETSRTPAEERDVAWKGAVRAQACDAARAVLPAATTSTVGIFASGQALESLIMHLQSEPMPEMRQTGEAILEEARKVTPAFLERADKPDRGGAAIAYRSNTAAAVKKLAQEYLSDKHADEVEQVQLVNVWPRNEFDLVPDMLYEHSNLPLRKIQEEVAEWPYEKRLKVFEAYVGERLNRRHKPGRALEKAHYSWDLICDYGVFREIQRHRMVDDLTWQDLTPRYGYDVPKLVDDAGMTEEFEQCFEISLKLHSLLQSSGYPLEAQYATLLGHKLRWKVTYNAREAFHLHELRTSPQAHPNARKLLQQMHEKLTEVHPLLGESMKFVNQGEDPELTRLAAERYTQFKLQQLDQAESEQE